MNNLVKILKEHGIEVKVINNKLFVLNEYYKETEYKSEWITIKANIKAVKAFLGY